MRNSAARTCCIIIQRTAHFSRMMLKLNICVLGNANARLANTDHPTQPPSELYKYTNTFSARSQTSADILVFEARKQRERSAFLGCGSVGVFLCLCACPHTPTAFHCSQNKKVGVRWVGHVFTCSGVRIIYCCVVLYEYIHMYSTMRACSTLVLCKNYMTCMKNCAKDLVACHCCCCFCNQPQYNYWGVHSLQFKTS